MKSKKIIMIILIGIAIALIGIVCYGNLMKFVYKKENPIATIKIEGYDEPMVLELYPEYAPNTVRNFITLANNEFYNGLTIHRIEEYVIQGGDPAGNGSGGPTLSSIDKNIEEGSEEDKDYSIFGEFWANGYRKNTLSHEKGVISMARSDYSDYSLSLEQESYNSAGSQFFICTKYVSQFNGNYAAFGKMISGWDTLDSIAKTELYVSKNNETGEETKTSSPINDIIIESISIDTKGVDYNKPDTLEPFDFYSWYYSRNSQS